MTSKPVHAVLRAPPRPLDPASTVVMIASLDPITGGIYCIDGKNELPVNGTIWSRDPTKDAGWHVMYLKDKNSSPVQVPHEDWRPVGFDLSEPHLTRGNITATINGVDYNCYRALTVIESESSERQPPVITTTVLPNGYVGVEYSATLEVSETSSEPITWALASPLPAGLELDPETGEIYGVPQNVVDGAFDVRALNPYGTDSGRVEISILGADVLDITVLKSNYTVGEAITSADLIVKYHDRVLPMNDLTGYVLTYNPNVAGTKRVKAVYDPRLEEISILARGEFEVTYTNADPQAPHITTTSLPNGSVGTAYSKQMEATGTEPITWSSVGNNQEK